MPNYDLNLVNSKYHVSVAKNLLEGFNNNETKNFLSVVIRELASAASNLIRAIIIFEDKKINPSKKGLGDFIEKIAPNHLTKDEIKVLTLILELRSAQKISQIEFLKKDKVIFLVNSKYKVLRLSKIKECLGSLDLIIKKIQKKFRQV